LIVTAVCTIEALIESPGETERGMTVSALGRISHQAL
jgi:hypothetical protein